jgi:hypothetical protein
VRSPIDGSTRIVVDTLSRPRAAAEGIGVATTISTRPPRLRVTGTRSDAAGALDGMVTRTRRYRVSFGTGGRPGTLVAARTAMRTQDDSPSDGATATDALGRGLGWFSIALGLAEVAAPHAVARLIGVRDDDPRAVGTLRAFGLRELASGVSILSRPEAPARVWSRFGGDVIDLAFLLWSLRVSRTSRQRLAIALGAVAGVAALDLLAGVLTSRRVETNSHEP